MEFGQKRKYSGSVVCCCIFLLAFVLLFFAGFTICFGLLLVSAGELGMLPTPTIFVFGGPYHPWSRGIFLGSRPNFGRVEAIARGNLRSLAKTNCRAEDQRPAENFQWVSKGLKLPARRGNDVSICGSLWEHMTRSPSHVEHICFSPGMAPGEWSAPAKSIPFWVIPCNKKKELC